MADLKKNSNFFSFLEYISYLLNMFTTKGVYVFVIFVGFWIPGMNCIAAIAGYYAIKFTTENNNNLLLLVNFRNISRFRSSKSRFFWFWLVSYTLQYQDIVNRMLFYSFCLAYMKYLQLFLRFLH